MTAYIKFNPEPRSQQKSQVFFILADEHKAWRYLWMARLG